MAGVVAALFTLAQAAALGVLQVNLTGGEPQVRDDLEALIASELRHRLRDAGKNGQVVLAVEVPVDQPHADLRLRADVVHRGQVEAAPCKARHCGAKDLAMSLEVALARRASSASARAYACTRLSC